MEPVTTSSATAGSVCAPLPLTVGASFTPVTVAVIVTALAAHEPVALARLPMALKSLSCPTTALVLVVSVWLLSARRTVNEPGVPWKLAAGTKCSCAAEETRIAAESLKAVVAVGGTAIQLTPLSSENSHTPCPAMAALPVMATYASAVSVLPPLLALWLSVVSP